jgi:SAM-dependent methyltransferase
MSVTVCSLEEFNARIDAIGPGVPDAAGHQSLSVLTIHHPAADRMRRMDPFSPAYRKAALDLYFDLRGRAGDGYQAARDEMSEGTPPSNAFTDVTPWCFQDTAMVAEFLDCWAQILRAMALPANSGASVLEYGPGSGQMLLMMARMGIHAHGVDIDQASLDSLRRQADAMGVPLETERAEFGEGFAGKQFDRIFFFEAFHHAFEFEALLLRLHERLKPGGRLILCGEPVLHSDSPGVPYPWGPRLDALSVFCMRRYGWMELGFSHEFLMELLGRTGWYVEFNRPTNSARALIYIAQRQCDRPAEDAPKPAPLLPPPPRFRRRVCNKLRRMTGW